MDTHSEELEYEEKMDRISEYLEELMLDAMLIVLDKIIKRNWQFANLSNQTQPDKMIF